MPHIDQQELHRLVTLIGEFNEQQTTELRPDYVAQIILERVNFPDGSNKPFKYGYYLAQVAYEMSIPMVCDKDHQMEPNQAVQEMLRGIVLGLRADWFPNYRLP